MTKALVKVSTGQIESAILFIRGERVIIDTDLAAIYDVDTRSLIQAVKRNGERFPSDFMFQLTRKEFDSLRSQSVISRGGVVDVIFPTFSQNTGRSWPQMFLTAKELFRPAYK